MATTITIQPGDSLSAIAAKFGTTVQALAQANGISNPNLIRSGASLTIPTASTTSASTQRTPVKLGNGQTVYYDSSGTAWTDPTAGNQVSQNTISGATPGTAQNIPTALIDTTSLPSTGNANLDTGQAGIATTINSNPAQYQIPANLQITPALTAQFLSWAHQAVDPQTKTALESEAANVNNSLANLETQYNQQTGQTIQDYGTKLADQDNTAGGNGVAFSGLRGLQDQNLTNTTNRTLASLAGNTGAQAGNILNSGAAAVGSANTGLFTTPNLSAMSVNNSNNTGINTTGQNMGGLNYNYTPSNYVTGTITDTGAQNVGNQQANYQTQYSNLAGNNSNGTRSMSDLLGEISGAPAGASTNLT